MVFRDFKNVFKRILICDRLGLRPEVLQKPSFIRSSSIQLHLCNASWGLMFAHQNQLKELGDDCPNRDDCPNLRSFRFISQCLATGHHFFAMQILFTWPFFGGFANHLFCLSVFCFQLFFGFKTTKDVPKKVRFEQPGCPSGRAWHLRKPCGSAALRFGMDATTLKPER